MSTEEELCAREHAKWVRKTIVEPAIRRWGKVAFARFSLGQREEIVAAECMAAVMSWALLPHPLVNADVVGLYREAMRQVREHAED